jgi:hypothetical protein
VEERPLRKQKKPAFESYVEKYYDEESGKAKYRTLYRKKTYTVYSAYRKVSMSASYKIISLSTGDVLGTDIITKAFESEVLYATYSGKKSRLYPSNEGHVSTSRAEYNRLQQLFRGNRNLASREVLTSEIYKEASDVVAKKIVNKFQ